MAVVVKVVLRDVSPEQYDRVREECDWLTQAPVGGHAHITWWDGGDCYNLDAWADEGAFQAFVSDRLGPAMARAGATTQPEVTIYPAHEVFIPAALTLT